MNEVGRRARLLTALNAKDRSKYKQETDIKLAKDGYYVVIAVWKTYKEDDVRYDLEWRRKNSELAVVLNVPGDVVMLGEPVPRVRRSSLPPPPSRKRGPNINRRSVCDMEE